MKFIRTVELFAGVGGFRLGLEAASDKFKVIWANQWEPSMREQYAFDCYIAHFGNGKHHVCQDIAKAKCDVPDHDLLVGGFPCQDYSIMKKNSAGIEGAKGALWWQIDDILQEKRPKYVLLENVDRIIRSPAKQCGRDFSIILRCFYEKGYAVDWRVINAADHGYAQRRRRTFIVAYHKQRRSVISQKSYVFKDSSRCIGISWRNAFLQKHFQSKTIAGHMLKVGSMNWSMRVFLMFQRRSGYISTTPVL